MMRNLFLAVFGCLLFFDSYTQIAPPVIEWSKCLGGTRAEYAKSIIRTRDNGWLVVGRSYSNDGNVSGHHGSLDSADAWVVKINEKGDIQWQRSLGGSREDNFNDVIELSNGDFICVGSTESENGDISGLHTFTQGGIYYSFSDLWVVRLSSSGQLLWSKVFGGTDPDNGAAIKKAVDGGYIIAGEAESNDFDVTGSHGWSDIWVFKIDDAGNIVWQKVYGNYNAQYTKSLTVTSDGNYVIGGYQYYKGYPTFIEPVYSEYRDCMLKINRNGDLVWENYTGFTPLVPGRSDYISKMLELPSGTFISVGHWYYATEDNDARWLIKKIDKNTGNTSSSYNSPNGELFTFTFYHNQTGPNTAVLLSDSTVLSCVNGMGISPAFQVIDAHLYRFRTDSIIFQYRKKYGGNDIDLFTGIASINDAEFGVVGQTKSNDGDASGNHGDYDFWVVKFNAANKIKGNVFVDNNNNGIKDITEPFYANAKVETGKNGHIVASSTDSLGRFLNLVDTGNYSTAIKLNIPYYTLVPPARQSNFSGYNGSDSFSLAMVPIPGKKDLLINCIPLDPTRAGFTFRYKITYSNVGTETISNCIVRFVKDFYLEYVSSSPAYSTSVGDTITWSVGSLTPLSSSSIIISFRVPAPPAVNITTILSSVSLLPLMGEETPENNSMQLFHRVTGSYDPNAKDETNGGSITLFQVANKEDLNYTIRFQNTGTDTAFNVEIKDTLSSKLDWSSFQMVNSSHPGQLKLESGILVWTFKNILLPDSNRNEPASHGYINYRIKPKVNLLLGDTISNAASIYFDFNGGVQTNIQLTIVKAAGPPQPIVTGLLSSYCSNQGIQKGKIINLPPPGSGTTATVKLDATILPVANDSTFSFDVNALPAASYSILVTFSNNIADKTSTHYFNNTNPVLPDVNVSANITNIISLATPVILTGINATGGGSGPLFAFSKDRTFATTIQPEGPNNVLTIDPVTLAIGDNWIYIRMKSNASCITTQSVMDSIKLVRDQATGITDPDNPGKAINIFPNPFIGQLYINGLSPGKTYILYLTNVNGQLLQQQRISNQSNAELELHKEKLGTYILSIYDVKKKLLLGTIKIIKQ